MFDSDGTLSDNFKNEVAAVPTGTIFPFLSSIIPNGFVEANGQEISRTDFAQLFLVIGTTYGAGNGTTTFKVPDLRNRFLVGRSTTAITGFTAKGIGFTGGAEEVEVTIEEGNLPPHAHDIGVEGVGEAADEAPGMLRTGAGEEIDWVTNDTSRVGHTRDAGGAIIGDAEDPAAMPMTVETMPPWFSVAYIIKT